MITSSSNPSFEINLKKDTFKFNAAHFVAFPGFRERLHGHNYTVAVRLLGGHQIGGDGYVLDFGDVKKVVKKICKDMNELFICPMRSNALQITVDDGVNGQQKGGRVMITCEDGSEFMFPKEDCLMLPIVHSTVEELAIYLWGKVLTELDPKNLLDRGIHTMELTCTEAPGQEAVFRLAIPTGENTESIEELCDVHKYIRKDKLYPQPCCSKH